MRTIRSSAALSAALCPVVFALSVTAAVAAEFKYDPGDDVQFTYCYSHQPVLRIKPGDTVVTSTKDASNDVYAVERQDAVPQARLEQGQSANRAVLHRGRRARRHAGGAHRQDRLQPGLGLGRVDSLLRRARARIQDDDDHAAGAGPAVHLAHRPRPARGHARPAQQQDRQGRGPAAAVLRHHRHGACRQGVHQLAGTRIRTAPTWTSTRSSKA